MTSTWRDFVFLYFGHQPRDFNFITVLCLSVRADTGTVGSGEKVCYSLGSSSFEPENRVPVSSRQPIPFPGSHLSCDWLLLAERIRHNQAPS